MIRRIGAVLLAAAVAASSVGAPAPAHAAAVAGGASGPWSVRASTTRVAAAVSAGPDATYATLTLENKTSLADELHLDAVTAFVLKALGLSGTYSQTARWSLGTGPALACITWANVSCTPSGAGGGRVVIAGAIRSALQAQASANPGDAGLLVAPDAQSAATDIALVAIGIYLGVLGINVADAEAVIKLALSMRTEALVTLNALERNDFGAVRESLAALVEQAGVVILQQAVKLGISAAVNALTNLIPGVVAVKIGLAVAKAAVPLGNLIAALATGVSGNVTVSYSGPGPAPGATTPPTPAPTSATGAPFSTGSTPLIAGTAWLGGHGVDVFSNGSSTYLCPDNPPGGWTADQCNSSVKIAGRPVAVGTKWQCVELAQRLWVTKGWWPTAFPVGTAAELWPWAMMPAVSAKLKPKANGALSAADLAPGDLVVWNAMGAIASGHVAVVDRVSGSDVFVKEQNWGNAGEQTGEAVYTLSGGWLSGHRLWSTAETPYIAGVIRHPGSTTSTPPPPPAPKVDLVFVIDTTYSMNPYIAGVKAAATRIVGDVLKKSDARVAVVEYRDFYMACPQDLFAARLDVPFTSVKSKVLAGIDALAVGDGCDTPESVYSGLMTAISLPWRAGSKKAIILMGDQPPHDPEPVTGYTLAMVTAAAEAVDPANVYAVDIEGNGAPLFRSLAEGTTGAYASVTTPAEAVSVIVHDVSDIARAPVAIADGPYLTEVGVPVTFDGGRSYAPDGRLVKYEWDFDGNGKFDAASARPVASHTYAAPFTGTVALRVTDNASPAQTATVQVDVVVRARASVIPAPTQQPAPTPLPAMTPPPQAPGGPSPTPGDGGASPTPAAPPDAASANAGGGGISPAGALPGLLILVVFSLTAAALGGLGRLRRRRNGT